MPQKSIQKIGEQALELAICNQVRRTESSSVYLVNPERRLSAYALYDIGVLLPKLHHLLFAGLVCLGRLFGHHGGHFTEGTWNRIQSGVLTGR